MCFSSGVCDVLEQNGLEFCNEDSQAIDKWDTCPQWVMMVSSLASFESSMEPRLLIFCNDCIVDLQDEANHEVCSFSLSVNDTMRKKSPCLSA